MHVVRPRAVQADSACCPRWAGADSCAGSHRPGRPWPPSWCPGRSAPTGAPPWCPPSLPRVPASPARASLPLPRCPAAPLRAHDALLTSRTPWTAAALHGSAAACECVTGLHRSPCLPMCVRCPGCGTAAGAGRHTAHGQPAGGCAAGGVAPARRRLQGWPGQGPSASSAHAGAPARSERSPGRRSLSCSFHAVQLLAGCLSPGVRIPYWLECWQRSASAHRQACAQMALRARLAMSMEPATVQVRVLLAAAAASECCLLRAALVRFCARAAGEHPAPAAHLGARCVPSVPGQGRHR